MICSELKRFDKLKIILPRQALAFYDLSGIEIQARVTRLPCRNDTVLMAALKVIGDMKPVDAYFTIAIMCHVFDGEPKINQESLIELYDSWWESDPKGDELPDVLEHLLEAGLSYSDDSDYFDINISELPTALCAMYFDQKQRWSGDVFLALTTLLGVRPPRRKGSPRRPRDTRSRAAVSRSSGQRRVRLR